MVLRCTRLAEFEDILRLCQMFDKHILANYISSYASQCDLKNWVEAPADKVLMKEGQDGQGNFYLQPSRWCDR